MARKGRPAYDDDDDRTLVIERIPFGFRKEHLLGSVLVSNMADIIQSEMGPCLTTFTAVYNSPLNAMEALQVAQAAISATEEFKTMRVRLKSDVILRSQVELMETKQRSRDRAEHERNIFVRRLSPNSTFLSVQSFFKDFGTLDGTPSVFRNPLSNDVQAIVRFITKDCRDAAFLQLGWTKLPLKLDGSKIKVEPYEPRLPKGDKQIEHKKSNYVAKIEWSRLLRKTAVGYEEMAKGLIEKEDTVDRSIKDTIHLCLLNASLCQLLLYVDDVLNGVDDVESRELALGRIRALDLTFEGTRECIFVSDLSAAILERDESRFNDLVNEFSGVSAMEAWKTSLLSDILCGLVYLNQLQELEEA